MPATPDEQTTLRITTLGGVSEKRSSPRRVLLPKVQLQSMGTVRFDFTLGMGILSFI